MRTTRLLLIIVILSVLLATNGGGGGARLPEPPKKLVVCPEGPPTCQFGRIEDAVQAAGPMDLIFLRPGTYQETLVLEKSVRITATEFGQIRIQGQEPGKPTVTLKSHDDLRVSLEGVIIVGGPVPESSRACAVQGICPVGIALSGEGSVTFTLINSQITQAPGGLHCPRTLHSQGIARLILLSSRISTGDGIWLDGCDFREVNLALIDVTFAGNEANGVLIDVGGQSDMITVDIERSRFVANGVGLTAFLGGREVTSKLTIRDTWFLNNGYGARLSVHSGSTTEIRTSRFISNRRGLDLLGEQLGPLDEPEGFVLLENSVFTDNIERGLYVLTPSRVEARDNIIQNNGIGILVWRADSVFLLERNRIMNNREWGIALTRSPCVENPPTDPFFIHPIYIQGQDNEIRDNARGDLCPEDYNWPPNFRRP